MGRNLVFQEKRKTILQRVEFVAAFAVADTDNFVHNMVVGNILVETDY